MASLVNWANDAGKSGLPSPLISGLEYFISTLADVFEAVRLRAEKCAAVGVQIEPQALRRLDHRARIVLGLSERMARNLLGIWVKEGWLEIANPSRRARAYSLSAKYRQYIGSLSAKSGG